MLSGLSSLNSKVDKLGIGKSETPVDLGKLSNLVKNDVKKNECDELVEKVNAIQTTDTSNLVQ